MKSDPAKDRAWRQASAERYAAKVRARPREPKTPKPMSENFHSRRSAPRRNDGPWRAECLAKRGTYCRSCGSVLNVQMDHIKPRSQGGKSVVENGLPLCVVCHEAKTESRLQIRREWLDPDQIAWLAAEGWVTWDVHGQPCGEGWKHFAPRQSRA